MSKIAEPVGEQTMYKVGRTTVGVCSNCHELDQLDYIKGQWLCSMCNEYGLDRKKIHEEPDMINKNEGTFS